MLPPARIVDHLAAQDTGRAVEIEKQARAATCSMFQNEVAVEKHSFNLSKDVELLVQISPSGLDHTYFRICEKINGLPQEIGWRDEVSVEDGNQFACCRFESFL